MCSSDLTRPSCKAVTSAKNAPWLARVNQCINQCSAAQVAARNSGYVVRTPAYAASAVGNKHIRVVVLLLGNEGYRVRKGQCMQVGFEVKRFFNRKGIAFTP